MRPVASSRQNSWRCTSLARSVEHGSSDSSRSSDVDARHIHDSNVPRSTAIVIGGSTEVRRANYALRRRPLRPQLVPTGPRPRDCLVAATRTHDDHGNRRMPHDREGRAPEQRGEHPGSPSCAHHDEVALCFTACSTIAPAALPLARYVVTGRSGTEAAARRTSVRSLLDQLHRAGLRHPSTSSTGPRRRRAGRGSRSTPGRARPRARRPPATRGCR